MPIKSPLEQSMFGPPSPGDIPPMMGAPEGFDYSPEDEASIEYMQAIQEALNGDVSQVSPLQLSLDDDYSAEEAGPGAFSNYLEEAKTSRGSTYNKNPSPEEIAARRQKIDETLQRIVAAKQRPQMFDNMNLPRLIGMSRNPNASYDDIDKFNEKLANAYKLQSDYKAGRDLDPLLAELQRDTTNYGFINEDRKFAQEDMDNEVKRMQQYLMLQALSGKQAPTYQLKTIDTPGGKQPILFNPKNPDDTKPLGPPVPSKPSASQRLEINKLKGQKRAQAAALRTLEGLLESTKNKPFPAVTVAPETRGAVDRALGGVVPEFLGGFPGGDEAYGNFLDFNSQTSDLVLNAAEKLKPLSNSDIEFLVKGLPNVNMTPEERESTILRLIEKFKADMEAADAGIYDLENLGQEANAQNNELSGVEELLPFVDDEYKGLFFDVQQ